MLVPVIVIEGNKEIQTTATWEKQTIKIAMKKAKLSISFNKPVKCLSVRMASNQASVSKIDSGKTWTVVFSGVKAGTYPIEVNADGRLVSLPDLTLLSAIGNGDGDLP